MIPKIIHFCWFGGQPYPEVVQRCLDSWAQVLPDFTIMRWDESNAPTHLSFVADALDDEQWAFASDAVRLEVLREHGGVYLDTDMLVVAGLEPFLRHGAFLGCESDDHVNGAIIGARPHHPLVEALCEQYRASPYEPTGLVPIPQIITAVLRDFGVRPGPEITEHSDDVHGDICVYPPAFFYPLPWVDSARLGVDPMDYVTAETAAIHLWNMSWMPWSQRPVDPYLDGENYADALKVLTGRLRRRPLQRPAFYRVLVRTMAGRLRQRRGR